jgi:hypothetical protein
MKNVRRRILFFVLVCLLLITVSAKAVSRRTPKKYTAKELIAKIIASEKKMHDVELHFDDILVGRGNHIYRSFGWGYQDGKKYCAGKVFDLGLPERNIPPWENTERKTFDGEKFCSMSDKTNFPDGQVFKKGLCGRIGPDLDIFGNLYPNRLLGYELVKKHPVNRTNVTLGELLSTARRVSLRPKAEKVDGHSCLVVEAIGAKHVTVVGTVSGTKYEDSTLDIRVWIDTQRDFRPLRIETYIGDQDPIHAMGKVGRWQGPG